MTEAEHRQDEDKPSFWKRVRHMLAHTWQRLATLAHIISVPVLVIEIFLLITHHSTMTQAPAVTPTPVAAHSHSAKA